MKKVLAITVLLVLVCSAMASADATNWILTIKGSGADGKNYTALTIGAQTGANDAVNSAMGEPGNIGNAPVNGNLGVAATWITGATKAGTVDMKAPITTASDTRTWEVHFWQKVDANSPGPWTSMLVTITPGTGTSAPAYTFASTPYQYTFAASFIPGGSITYKTGGADGTMPASFAYTVNTSAQDYASGAVMTVTVSPAVPEPGSMLALGSGLIGLAGFAIRRRRS